jgi:hypothetical protein
MRARGSLLFVLVLCCFSVYSHAQLWSGILQPTRATDWTHAGIPGDVLPSASWPLCMTLSSGTISGSTIANDMASCHTTYPSGSYIQLPATFTLSSQVHVVAQGNFNVALRGTSPPTVITVQSGAIASCSAAAGAPTPFCINSTDTTYITSGANITSWIAGYSQGSSALTLASASGISSAASTMIFTEQCDTGYNAVSATAPCSGSAVDNSQLFICGDTYSGGIGCSIDGPDTGDAERDQMEVSYATNVSGNVVTIADPLKWPNWNVTPNLAPRVWYAQPIIGVGIENVSIDMSAGSGSGFAFMNALKWWVSGCTVKNFSDYGVFAYQSIHGVVKDNYFYHSTGSDSYGVRYFVASENLMQNNIITQVFAPFVNDGPAAGNVFGYNFIINDNYQSDFLRGSFFEHAVDGFDLYEGNVADNQWNDGDHGTEPMITRYRNFFTGWESCANGQCGSSASKDGWTNALVDSYGDRYENNVGNVAGTPTWHTTYKSNAGGLGGGDEHVALTPGPAQVNIPIDPLVMSTSLWWANYDVATGAARFCGNSSNTGWSTTCGSTSEIPTAATAYPNSVPTVGDTAAGQPALPASFYQSSKPAWFGSIPWPAIGPDVASGNVGQCTGTLNTPGQYAGVAAASSSQCTGTSLTTAWGGHVNAIPAMQCFLNVMGSAPDGTGNALTFNPAACYGASAQGPAAPTGLSATVQ